MSATSHAGPGPGRPRMPAQCLLTHAVAACDPQAVYIYTWSAWPAVKVQQASCSTHNALGCMQGLAGSPWRGRGGLLQHAPFVKCQPAEDLLQQAIFELVDGATASPYCGYNMFQRCANVLGARTALPPTWEPCCALERQTHAARWQSSHCSTQHAVNSKVN